MTLDEYLDLTDDQVQFLLAYNYGEYIVNPQYGTGVDTKERPDEEMEFKDEPQERELHEVTDQEKISDLDAPEEDQ
jgi:hypothetical protein